MRSRWASSSLPSLLELGQPLLELRLDALDGHAHALVAGDVVGGGEDHQLVEHRRRCSPVSGSTTDDALDLVAEQLDADGVLLVGGVDLEGVAPDPELAPHQVEVVALVLDVDQLAQDRALVVLLAHPDVRAAGPGTPRASPGRRCRHRGHDDDVAPGEQRGRGGRVAEPVDLVVDRRVLLDVGVARGEVGLGLVVVVVGDEVLDPVVRGRTPGTRWRAGPPATCWGR